MTAQGVVSLPGNELKPFLDRRRYSAFVTPRLQVDAFLRDILSKASEFVPAQAGSILMDRALERGSTASATKLYFVAAFGPAAEGLLGRSLLAEDGIVGYVYRTGKPYLMCNPHKDPNFFADFDESSDFETQNIIAVPVRIERTVCGVLELLNRASGRRFSKKDLKLLEIFASYTSVSIENLLDAQRANEMARRDDLTGLYNDRFFHHRLTEDLVRADVTGSSVGLLFLDLDNFKDVNDTHGHLAGSQVLKEFGYLLSRTIRAEGGTLARYGGDEFVVILPGQSTEDALKTAREVTTALRQTSFLQGTFSWAEGPIFWDRPLTCSIGVAAYPEHVPRTGTTDLKKNLLLRAADQAMYDAKADGKDQVKVSGAL